VQTNAVHFEIANNNTPSLWRCGLRRLTSEGCASTETGSFFFVIAVMGEANLELQFWNYTILNWTGLRMAKRETEIRAMCHIVKTGCNDIQRQRRLAEVRGKRSLSVYGEDS
jgi:hypothetical protein